MPLPAQCWERPRSPPTASCSSAGATYLPPALPGRYTISVAPAADPRKAVQLEVLVVDLSLELHPGSVVLAPGQEQSFRVNVHGPSGMPLHWSFTGGSLSPERIFKAPAEPGTYLVTVQHLPSGKRASARVTVANPFSIQPTAAELAPGQSMRFRAEGAEAWAVLEPEGGTVEADGTYTAPRKPGVFHIEALRPPHTAQTTVTVAAVTLSIAPTTAALGMGQRLQFKAEPSAGSCLWSASAGEISEDGLFHAPVAPGPCQITARSALAPEVSASAWVEVVVPSQVQILPDMLTLHVGQVQQFTALGLPPGASPTWLVQPASAGEITDDGRFSAGPVPGPCSVQVLLDDMMSSAALELIDTRILPDPARVRPGGTVQFTAQGLPSDAPVAWSIHPEGLGLISQGGLLTAGAGSGAGTVTASGGGIEAAAAFSILTSRIAPEEALVGPGETIRFTSEAYLAESPLMIWRLLGDQPGATLGQDGTYRSPTLQGVYRISATDASGHASLARVTVGPPQGLLVIPEVNILRDGVYTVRVRLQASTGRTVESTFTGELHRGLAYPEVLFPVKSKLAALEADGPYALARIAVSGSAGGETVVFDAREDLGATDAFPLMESRRDWIRIGATLEARGQDRTEAGLFRTLAVSIPVDLTSDGEYRVSGALLAEDGTELDVRSEVQAWTRGLHTATLLFDGRKIRAGGGTGPLSLARFTIEGPVVRVRNFPDAIKGFDSRMFEP